MKICVLRRDGQKVHNGMAMVIASITERFFGEKEIVFAKNKEVSRVNPLYAVRINA